MTRPTGGQCAAAALFCALFQSMVPGLEGQTPPPPASPASSPASKAADQTSGNAPKPKRASIGLRVRVLPFRSLSAMADNQTMTTTFVAKTPYDFNFNTTSSSLIVGGGLAAEFALGRKTFLTAEVLYGQLHYNKLTNTYWGTNDPETAADERSHTSVAENTNARLFDVPVLLHYGGLRPSGLLSHMYLAAGASAREVTDIRTANTLTDTGGTVTTNQNRAVPSRRTVVGGVIGIGFRFVDDFNIKVTPEIRYTRWVGSTFGSDSTQSPKNQLEIGIAFTR